ncbi:hypothetical protein J6590_059628 [Homalodisca vitripennis]|nr:hypothetical protein J6590_059628 [Homalodisca vitripennis]
MYRDRCLRYTRRFLSLPHSSCKPVCAVGTVPISTAVCGHCQLRVITGFRTVTSLPAKFGDLQYRITCWMQVKRTKEARNWSLCGRCHRNLAVNRFTIHRSETKRETADCDEAQHLNKQLIMSHLQAVLPTVGGATSIARVGRSIPLAPLDISCP